MIAAATAASPVLAVAAIDLSPGVDVEPLVPQLGIYFAAAAEVSIAAAWWCPPQIVSAADFQPDLNATAWRCLPSSPEA